MADNKRGGPPDWLKWSVGSLILLLGSGGGIVALVNLFNTPVAVPALDTSQRSAEASDTAAPHHATVTPLHPACEPTWTWNADRQRCEKTLPVPAKTISIPLEAKIQRIDGRIDFYLNEKLVVRNNRLDKTHPQPARGVLQVVIPIMKGDKQVGRQQGDDFFRTDEGMICSIASLPETTGHLKNMHVRYSLNLAVDCPHSRFCTTTLGDHGKRVDLRTTRLTVTIAKRCS